MKQFHKAIVNTWFNLNILETIQSNDLIVPTNPSSINLTAQRNQREPQLRVQKMTCRLQVRSIGDITMIITRH